jgi:hypothetical protein
MIISRGLVGPNRALNRRMGMESRLIFRHLLRIRHIRDTSGQAEQDRRLVQAEQRAGEP